MTERNCTASPSRKRIQAPLETCADGAFRFGQKLGTGSFGDVFLGTYAQTGEEVAIKLESAKTTTARLGLEIRIYKMFSSVAGTNGIATMHWSGVQSCWNILVLDLLGPSLDRLISLCGGRFTVETVSMIGEQLVSCLEVLHSKMYVHRDIKPQNFMVGLREKQSQLYMIDFGLAKQYYKDGEHIPNIIKEGRVGTTPYVSVNAHQGCEPSRRDDLESLGYMLIYFAKGNLPWRGLKQRKSKASSYKKIGELKSSIHAADLCAGLPDEFSQYIEYCKSLAFEQTPDYTYLRQLWMDAQYEIDDRSRAFDWAKWKDKLYDILLEEAPSSSRKLKTNLFNLGELAESAAKIGNSFAQGIQQESCERCADCRDAREDMCSIAPTDAWACGSVRVQDSVQTTPVDQAHALT